MTKTSDVSPELADLGIEEVRIARVEPGDVIVLRTSQVLDVHDANMIRERCSAFFEGHEVVILQDDLSLEIVRKGGEQ